MIPKEIAKALLAKFYLEGDLTEEESIALNDFAKRYTFESLHEEMREDPKYKELMPLIELYRGILKDKIMGFRDNQNTSDKPWL